MNWKKIGLYILLSFGISWSMVLVMKLANIAYGSTLSTVVIAGLVMPGPAIATFIIQKFIYKEGFKAYGWMFDKRNYRWFLATPLIFIALILLTFAVIRLLGNTQIITEFGSIDFSQSHFNSQFKIFTNGKMPLPDISSGIFFIIMLMQGLFAAITVNLPFMFGEEFGWRGLMFKETQKLGFLKSSLFIGFTWGIWHMPVILMGHNYPKHPYAGIGIMCLLAIVISPIFSYIRVKTKSVLGPCILHGMINATSAMFVLFTSNADELYGSIAGWAGIIAGTIVTICIYLFDRKFVNVFADAE